MENVKVTECYKKFEDAMSDVRKFVIEMWAEYNDDMTVEDSRAIGLLMTVMRASMNLVAEQSRALDELNRKMDVLMAKN